MTSSSPQQLQPSGADNAQELTSTLTTDESSSIEILPTSSAEMLLSLSTENPSFDMKSSGETLSLSTENLSFNVESSGETPSEALSSFQISATELDGSSPESISFTLHLWRRFL